MIDYTAYCSHFFCHTLKKKYDVYYSFDGIITYYSWTMHIACTERVGFFNDDLIDPCML